MYYIDKTLQACNAIVWVRVILRLEATNITVSFLLMLSNDRFLAIKNEFVQAVREKYVWQSVLQIYYFQFMVTVDIHLTVEELKSWTVVKLQTIDSCLKNLFFFSMAVGTSNINLFLCTFFNIMLTNLEWILYVSFE